MDDRPIGIFDSGLGGLTVLKEMRKILPAERFVYFGDCGRTPYGVKSPETVRRYSFQNTRFFIEIGVKLLVIACNTSSACAFNVIEEALEFPVIEVIRPGSAAAARSTRNKKVGVIGTSATIASRVYEDVFYGIDPSIEIFTKACPLFVPLAEEGPRWWGHESARVIAAEYLGGLRETGIDCLLLGCTHYPLLAAVIREVIGADIGLISSARAVAAEARDRLESLGMLREGQGTVEGRELGESGKSGKSGKPGEPSEPGVSFYTSDSPEKFEPLCVAILGESADARVQKLDIEKYESRLP